MRLVIEVDGAEYEALEDAHKVALCACSVELRQADGLFVRQRRVLRIEGIGSFVQEQYGLESGPAMVLWLAPEDREEQS